MPYKNLHKFMAISFLLSIATPAFAADAIVTAGLNIRSGPGANYKLLGKVAAMDRMDVVSCNTKWCQIQKGKLKGWVAYKYVAFKLGSAAYNRYLPSSLPPVIIQQVPVYTNNYYNDRYDNNNYYDNRYYDPYYDDDYRYRRHHKRHHDHNDNDSSSSWSPPPSPPSITPPSPPPMVSAPPPPSPNLQQTINSFQPAPPPPPPPSPPAAPGSLRDALEKMHN